MTSHPAEADPDVLIVGAGPTGAVAAKRFAEGGLRVIVLEQGEWPDYSKARADHPDFELTAGRYWSGNPNRRGAPADYPIDDSDSDISAVLYNAVGGGTVIYAAHWQRHMPSDFRVRTLDGIADDWPLTYEDLQPYYERVELDFGVSGLAGDPAFPPGKGPPLPPGPLAPMGRRVAKAHNQLGWHWWPGPNGIGTPRILLLSASSKFPNGLANASGLVGRRLMMHPFGTVVGLFNEDLGSTHGLWGQHIHCLEFYETNRSRGFARGAKWGLQPTG